MPLAARARLFSPGGSVTLTALKWSGASVALGSLVAATTVRAIAGGAGGVCAAADTASITAPSSAIPVVLNRMIASPFNRHFAFGRLSVAEFGRFAGLSQDFGWV